MKLKKLLFEHHQCKPSGSLPDHLGDGYLIQNNPIYRNVRKAALADGVRFSSERFEGYDVLPLTQLPKILESKTVPYAPNVPYLDEIEKKIPDHFQLAQLPPLRANYVLHEAAHIIARLLRVRHWGSLQLGSASERQLALAIMMEEAFANACESLLCLASNNMVHDQFLLKNAYIHEAPEMRKRLRKAVHQFGFIPVFRLVFLSFVHANFLKTKVNPKEFDRMINWVFQIQPALLSGIDSKSKNDLKQIFLGGFDLDPLFTGLTNSFCLRYMGIKTPLPQLFEFDFMTMIEKDSGCQKFTKSLGEVLSK